MLPNDLLDTAHVHLNRSFIELAKLVTLATGKERTRLVAVGKLITEATTELVAIARDNHSRP